MKQLFTAHIRVKETTEVIVNDLFSQGKHPW